jgi:hypothetical protein
MAGGRESPHVPPENRKKQRFYNTYLADPNVEMPRTTQYRKRFLKKTNSIDANDTNILGHELANNDNIRLCENIPEDEKNFEEDVLNLSFLDAKSVIDNKIEAAFNPSDDINSNAGYNGTKQIDINEFEDDFCCSKEHVDHFADDDNEDHELLDEETAAEKIHDEGDKEMECEKNRPLYEGAPICLAVSMLLIITFAVRHSLTGVALADLLILIETHLISSNYFRTTTASLRRFFKKLKNPVEFHYYCCFCYEYIGTTRCTENYARKGLLL